MSSFEPIYTPDIKGILHRLEHAANRATENAVHQTERWHGWLTYQTGIAFPLDLFTKYVQALDYRDAMEAYGTVEDVEHAHRTIQTYLNPLTAIVYSHVGLPRKVSA